MTEVWLEVPGDSGLRWLQLAAGVTEQQAATIREGSLWRVRCVEEGPTGTAASAMAAQTSSTVGTEYDVWMQYPMNNSKMPWGLIARGITAGQATAFTRGMVRRVSIQPREGTK